MMIPATLRARPHLRRPMRSFWCSATSEAIFGGWSLVSSRRMTRDTSVAVQDLARERSGDRQRHLRQPEARGHGHEVRKGAGLHLAHHLAPVCLHCDLADAEFAADLF